MGLPKMALRYGQLEFLTDNEVPKSGHKVTKARFKDPAKSQNKESGDQYTTVFFKPLSSDYPALGALLSVASSILGRLMLGENAAEERLVFNDKDELVGTASINLPNLKPMAQMFTSLPQDPEERERVCPSIETLLKHATIEVLLPPFIWGCDDRHPGNLDLDHTFDYDMWLYFIVQIIKGARTIQLQDPIKAMQFSEDQISDFPIISGRTHWPTNEVPANLNLARICAAKAAFQALAANPSIKIGNRLVSAQEQLFNGLLKALVTFEPILLKKQLYDYIGDLKLNYLDLPESKHQALSKYSETLFNTATNDQPFSDFFMKIAQNKYNEFYATTVFKPRTTNIKGVPVPSFRNFLSCQPSAIENIKRWSEEQNKIQCEKRKAEALGRGDTSYLPSYDNYDIKLEDRRYWQIYRDAHFPLIHEVQREFLLAKFKLINTLRTDPIVRTEPNFPRPSDPKITHAKKLVSCPAMYEELPKVNCDETNPVFEEGLKAVHEFGVKLQTCIDKYFAPECASDLTEEHNIEFCRSIALLTFDYEPRISRGLGKNSEAKSFIKIMALLGQFTCFNIKTHSVSDDIALGSERWPNLPLVPIVDHTSREVIKANIEGLFAWVRSLSLSKLHGLINEATEKYKPTVTMLSYRKRHVEVEKLMKEIKDPVNLLGRILSDGECKTGSLNCTLLTILFEAQTKEQFDVYAVNFNSVRTALVHQEFKVKPYANYAQEYSRSERFTHALAKSNVQVFNQAMYAWADAISVKDFKKIFAAALKKYNDGRSSISSLWATKRETDIDAYYTAQESNADILIKVFAFGTQGSSLSTMFLKYIVADMKKKHKPAAILPLLERMLENKMSNELFTNIRNSLKDYALEESKKRSVEIQYAKESQHSLEVESSPG